MEEGNTGSSKAGIYALIVLGILSMLFAVFVIVGGIFAEYVIITGVNKVHEQVDKAYQVTDNTITSAKNFVEKIDTGFNVVAPLVVVLNDADKQEVVDSIDRMNEQVSDVQGFLDDTKDSIDSANQKIDVVNSINIVELPKLSGERVQNASDTVGEFSDTLGELEEDVAEGSVSRKVIDRVNEGIDNTQGTLNEYQTAVSDARQDTTNFKNLIILWSGLGTIFIVGFFIWSMYSFYYFTKDQFAKLRKMKEEV